MTDIEEKTLQVIETATESKYTSSFKVEVDEDSYVLKMAMTQFLSPFVLSYQGTEEGFLKFIDREFRQRQLEEVSYFIGMRTEDNTFNGIL